MRHRFITIGRIIKGGLQNFVRNITLAVAAMAVMVITLTIVLFSLIANTTFSATIKQITDRIDISVYLKDEVNPQQREKLISDIKGLPNIREVVFVSKDDVLKQNKELLDAASQIDNPLPATIRIKPDDPNKIEGLRQFLEKPEVKQLQAAETSYSGDRKEAIDKISKATSFIRQAGLAGVIVFMCVSVLIIFNTIRMAIFNRRDELQIMRLLGAATSYIRGPFVVETVLYGIMSAIISVALCKALFSVAATAFDASSLGLLDIAYASNYFSKNFWLILTAQLGVGILIGAASSIIATRRYLKFKSTK